MFTFTESAGALLAQMIEQEKLADDMAFRIISNSEGIFFEQDTVRPGDAKFEHEGRVVLLLDAGWSRCSKTTNSMRMGGIWLFGLIKSETEPQV